MYVEYSVQKAMARLQTAKATMVIRNARVVNVFTKEILEQDVAIAGETIIGVGDHYDAPTVFDAKGLYLCPGLVDAHAHIESSMLAPEEYCRLAAANGTAIVVADPHELANICGTAGIRYMLESTQISAADLYLLFPDIASATTGKIFGENLTADEVSALAETGRVIDWGEMTDYQGATASDEGILKTLNLVPRLHIDGQAPGLSGSTRNAYCVGELSADSAADGCEEAMEMMRRGMYIQLRMSFGGQEMDDVFRGIAAAKLPLDRFMLGTDGRDPETLCREGHVNYILRRLVACGIDPLDAIRMASINATRAYRLLWRGAIAPGYIADMVLFENLRDFRCKAVFQKGNLYFNKPLRWRAAAGRVSNTVHVNVHDPKVLELPVDGEMPVVQVVPGEIRTKLLRREVPAENGLFAARTGYVKLAVMERRFAGGNVGLGILEGLPIQKGAIGTSISHDVNDLVVAGDNDEDMLLAVRTLEKMGGGCVVIREGKVAAKLALPLAGRMSDLSAQELLKARRELLNEAAKAAGITDGEGLFTTLAYITLPTLPEARVTERGVFDVAEQRYYTAKNNEKNAFPPLRLLRT